LWIRNQFFDWLRIVVMNINNPPLITVRVLFLFLSNPPNTAVNPIVPPSWSRHYRCPDRRPIKRDPYLESDSVLFYLSNSMVPSLSRSWSKDHKTKSSLTGAFSTVNIVGPPILRSWSKAHKTKSSFRERPRAFLPCQQQSPAIIQVLIEGP
jgi:hypothetical protein